MRRMWRGPFRTAPVVLIVTRALAGGPASRCEGTRPVS